MESKNLLLTSADAALVPAFAGMSSMHAYCSTLYSKPALPHQPSRLSRRESDEISGLATLKIDSKNKNAIIAIGTNNYFHQAVALWRSIKCFEKKSDFIFFVIGYDEKDPDYQNAEFIVLDAEVLFSDEELTWKQFLFQYSAKQVVCALKPLALLYTLKKYEKVIYLDIDIKLFGPLKTGWEALEGADLALTPHYYHPIPTGLYNENFRLQVRMSGIFNAGYIGATRLGGGFLKWWWEQTKHNCIVAIVHGIFGDQKWLDNAIGLVQRLHIIQDRSYNVAYWNLHERNLHKKQGRYLVGKEPLTFFHFSGLSKESNFSQRKNEPLFCRLFREYYEELEQEREKISPKEYPFSHFEDGELIDDLWREWMRRGVDELEKTKDPFLLNRSAREQIEEAMLRQPHQFRPKLEREI